MNNADEKAVVDFFSGLLSPKKVSGVPVVAFDSTTLFAKLRNVRVRRHDPQTVIDQVNEVLSGVSVCNTLGGIFTVCHYELSVWFIIRADLVVSSTPAFDPKTKAFPFDSSDEEEETVGTSK